MNCNSNKYRCFRVSLFILTLLLISNAFALAKNSANTIDLNYEFRAGSLGWTAGFADYPPGTDPDGSLYELFAGLRYLPRKLTRVPRRGFYIQGNNRSDDLYMFLKRRLGVGDGIAPGQTYRVEYVITLASNAPSGCAGAGGPPGEAVVLIVGASSIEPLAVLQSDGFLRMNVDKGSEAGNIANGIPCSQASPYYPFALIQRSHHNATDVTATAKGELWLLVGTDSGFEGLTRLYYQSIRVRLVPVLSFGDKIE